MPITRADFENLCEVDLQTLLDNEVPEGIHIEYKRELYGGADSEKKEFLKDVSSFANTAGGHIVIGIAATDGVPTELRGLAVGNPDSEQQRFESLLRDRMEPRIVGIRMAPVALKNGLRALAIRIPRSWNLPHAVMHNKARLVFARNSAGAHEASVDEMRAMFLAGATFLDRARDFHRERLKIIHENRGPLSNLSGEGGRVVLHIIPFSAFDSESAVDPARFQGQELTPIWCSGYNQGFNVDGYWTTSGGNGRSGYVQVFRTGIIEAAAGDVRSFTPPRGQLLYAESLEDQVTTKLKSYLSALDRAGVPPPLLVIVGGVRMAGTFVAGTSLSIWMDPLPLPGEVSFPAIRIENYGPLEDYRRALKPIFDAVWNAAGHGRSQSFSADGQWIRRS
jgi:Putative DNA-binding domain